MTEYPPGAAGPYPSQPAGLQPGGNVTEYQYESDVPPVPPASFESGSTSESESSSVSDKASNTVDAGKQAAADVAQTATEKAKDVAQETKKQARDLMGEARNQVGEQVGGQHRNLVDNLHSLAGELGTMAERSDGGGMATDLVSQAGDRVHSVAEWLGQREPGDLLQELRTFARQRPGTFLLGAAVAGVLAGRLTRGVVATHSEDGGDSGNGHSSYGQTSYNTGSTGSPSYGAQGSDLPGGTTGGYGFANPGELGDGYSTPPVVGYGPGGEVTP